MNEYDTIRYDTILCNVYLTCSRKQSY